MKKGFISKAKRILANALFLFFLLLFFLFILFIFSPRFLSGVVQYSKISHTPVIPSLDTALYDLKLNELANNPLPKPPITKITRDPKTGEEKTVTIEPKPVVNLWPAST